MAINDPAGSLARLALATVIVLVSLVAAGLVLEGIERSTSIRLLVLGAATTGGVLWYRGAKYGVLPSSLIYFDPSGTGLEGAPARVPVHVTNHSAAAPAGL